MWLRQINTDLEQGQINHIKTRRGRGTGEHNHRMQCYFQMTYLHFPIFMYLWGQYFF
jgi:hypothetical protein